MASPSPLAPTAPAPAPPPPSSPRSPTDREPPRHWRQELVARPGNEPVGRRPREPPLLPSRPTSSSDRPPPLSLQARRRCRLRSPSPVSRCSDLFSVLFSAWFCRASLLSAQVPANQGDAVLLPSSEPKSLLLFPVAGPSHHCLGRSLPPSSLNQSSHSVTAPPSLLLRSSTTRSALAVFLRAGDLPGKPGTEPSPPLAPSTDQPEFPTTGETSVSSFSMPFLFRLPLFDLSMVDSFLNHRPALPAAYQCCRTMSLLNLLHPDAVAALLVLCVQRLYVAEQGREKLASKMMIELRHLSFRKIHRK
jgi:hypothetical protein